MNEIMRVWEKKILFSSVVPFPCASMLRHKRESPWVANRRVGVRQKLLRKIGHRESEDNNFYF